MANQCSHPGCGCEAHEGSYCSETCREQGSAATEPAPDGTCGCGHEGCRAA